MASIGFIGVGNMGGPMARNLLKAGHSVKAYDVSPDALNYTVQAGAAAAQSPSDATRGADIVITMLPTGKEVRDVVLNSGVLDAADAGAILIDSSTIDVESAQAVHKAAADAGLAMLDAPVSGGTMGAEAGSLTFMCGGAKATFERARPVLVEMGKSLIHCGGPGLGQAAKVCNNMVAGISMLALSESFVMGERLGLDRQTLFDVMSSSTAGSWILDHMCPVVGPVPTAPASQDYKPGFAAALMTKDLRLAQAAARSADTATPVGALAASLFAMHIQQGNGDLDSTSIYKLIAGIARD